jgi:hypothetical protein
MSVQTSEVIKTPGLSKFDLKMYGDKLQNKSAVEGFCDYGEERSVCLIKQFL